MYFVVVYIQLKIHHTKGIFVHWHFNVLFSILKKYINNFHIRIV